MRTVINSRVNHSGFIDDNSISDTPEGMHKLLNVVQELTAWCGMQINVKKTYLLVIDHDKKRREQEPAPLLTMNGESLQAMNLDDACRYLGYWGMGNGDVRATKDVVRQKIIAARDLIKCHPLTPELAAELFTSKGVGVFRFSAALIERSESELNDVKRLCVQAYKNAWHLIQSTASAFFIVRKHAQVMISIKKMSQSKHLFIGKYNDSVLSISENHKGK